MFQSTSILSCERRLLVSCMIFRLIKINDIVSIFRTNEPFGCHFPILFVSHLLVPNSASRCRLLERSTQRPTCPPSYYSPSSLLNRRNELVENHPKKAPSDAGKPRDFAADQKKGDPAFYFNPPPLAAATIPITLYHPILGRFQDDCEHYIPTKEDHDFVLKFSQSMSDFYGNEDKRAERARADLQTYDLDFIAGRISTYTQPMETCVGRICATHS